MEASQASEAGSIPVARSSPARPRAGRFCYAHFAPSVYRMRRTIGATLSPRELGPAVPVQNSPCTPHTPPVPVQNSPHTSHTVPVPVQNSPSTSHTVPVPVQNSPSTPKMSQFGAFCSCWESFIPFLLPTSRAWRVFSRTNTSNTTGTKETTPPRNTQSHAMKDYPPTRHRQHHTMKHSSPQHATNNQNSPTFTMQGRTFFHNTHHTPTPGRHFFQPTPLPAK